MELLTFSNIITLIKEYYCYSITSEELTKNIISELVNEDYKIKLNSSILNKYYNGERDLPSLIKENLEKKKYKNNFINYIKDVIYKELVSVLIDDFFYKLKNIINNDYTITPKTKNKLLYYENDYPEFLSTSFVYAIKKIIRNLLHILVLVMMIYFYITKPINNVLYVENYYLKN